jgi:NAD(P)-dependent dehydrogenase (short-subunit alcohol dehydrogenase family)
MALTTDRAAGIAVITGAASGMGEATATLMARSGWPVLLTDLDRGRLDEVAQRLAAQGPVATLPGDIAAAGFVPQLSAVLQGRALGALVHCAGLSPTMGPPERILEVNLAATIRLVTGIRPLLLPGGAAVLFASTAAHMMGAVLDEQISKVTSAEEVAGLLSLAPRSEVAYSVSKRGVMLLVRREARAFGQRGARIVSLSPGIIDTPMGRAEMAKQPVMKSLVETSPLQRPARAEEVAQVAMFLCSAAASFITGTDLLVDGGSIGAILSGAT